MNNLLLKSKMVLHGDEDFVNAVAGVLNVTRQTAAAKLAGTSEFSQSEISKISYHYHLTDSEIKEIFVTGDGNDGKRSGETAWEI